MTLDIAKLKAAAEKGVEVPWSAMWAGAVLELIAALEAMVAAHMNLKLLADVYRQAYEEARTHSAELEARTLRVNMPALRNTEMMSDLAWNSAIDQCFDALIKAADEAGINLETGG